MIDASHTLLGKEGEVYCAKISVWEAMKLEINVSSMANRNKQINPMIL